MLLTPPTLMIYIAHCYTLVVTLSFLKISMKNVRPCHWPPCLPLSLTGQTSHRQWGVNGKGGGSYFFYFNFFLPCYSFFFKKKNIFVRKIWPVIVSWSGKHICTDRPLRAGAGHCFNHCTELLLLLLNRLLAGVPRLVHRLQHAAGRHNSSENLTMECPNRPKISTIVILCKILLYKKKSPLKKVPRTELIPSLFRPPVIPYSVKICLNSLN